MGKDQEYKKHLQEIFLFTPSGIEKLLATWDYLDVETKVYFFFSPKGSIQYYLTEKIYKKALSDPSAYIRYLAAKGFWLDDKNPEHIKIKAMIEADPSPLVKYSLLEIENLYEYHNLDIDAFFSLPHGARLAKVRNLSGSSGKVIAKMLERAPSLIKENKISELEVLEIIEDFLGNTESREFFKFSSLDDILSLWQIIPELPVKLTYPLLQVLPTSKYYGGNWEGMPLPFDPSNLEENEILTNTLDSLTDFQLNTILPRDDVILKEYRKKIFFESKGQGIKNAASCSSFDFTHEEFASLIPDFNKIEVADKNNESINKKLYVLIGLGSNAKNLSWVYYDAIDNLLRAFSYSGIDTWGSKNYLEQLLKEAKDRRRETDIKKQTIELKLYQLAYRAAPWKTNNNKEFDFLEVNVPTELYFLNKEVSFEDTWKTFMSFSEAWSKQKNSRQLEKYLPTIDDFDDDYEDLGTTKDVTINDTLIALRNQQYLIYILIALVVVQFWG